MNFKKIIILSLIFIAVISIPITLFLIQKNSDNRSRASGTDISISLTSPINKYPISIPYPVEIKINSGATSLELVDIKLKFDPKVIQAITFIPSREFDTQTTPSDISSSQQQAGEFRYQALETFGKNLGGTIDIGKFYVSGKIPATTKIEVSYAQIGSQDNVIDILPASLPITFENPATDTTSIPSASTSNTPTTTPTDIEGDTTVTLKVILAGIGIGSENLRLNKSPLHPIRTATIQIADAQNQPVKTITGSINFDTKNIYEGKFSLGPQFRTGQYKIKIKLSNTLYKSIPVLFQINTGQNSTQSIEPIILTSGDLNNDNILDVIDWTAMITCIKKQTSCGTEVQNLADLNDNGKVDELDVQILQRGFTLRNGD